MEGIKNFLQLIYAHWVDILIIIGLVIGIIQKTKNYLEKTDDEKIEIAKKEISNAILKMITDAEKDYGNWAKSGAIKRSQVIKQIYSEFPILERVADQNQMIAWIDEEIDNALKTLRAVIKENQ